MSTTNREVLHNYGEVSLCNAGDKGRGIFANNDMPAGHALFVCPVVVLTERDTAIVEVTRLGDYTFHWPWRYDGEADEESPFQALVLGLGSMLNHSFRPSCTWEYDPVKLLHTTLTRRRIRAGEELTINYGWDVAKG